MAKAQFLKESAAEDITAAIIAGLDKSVANLQLPDKDLRDYYLDQQDRVIWLDYDIDDSAMVVVRHIMKYNHDDDGLPVEQRKPIRLIIDTAGGSVAVMMIIVNAIKMSKTPVWTINWCGAYSAGAHILAAGHKRLAMPGSTVLIHSGSCAFSGTQEQATSAKDYYDKLTKIANDQLIADTKIEPKMFKRKAAGDWYLTTDEALQYGVVDKIITDFSEIYSTAENSNI